MQILQRLKSSYLGNSRLKQIGYNIDYAPEQILEIQRCAEDPIYFIETYCKIVSLDHGLVPFKLMSVRNAR
jgi:hypothetical protein